jgi:drug/metabolite transporter (DMT)-like permease
MNRSTRSNLLLMLSAVIWGFAFVAQRLGMEHVGPFAFNAVRFALGASILLPVLALTRQRRAAMNASVLKPGARATLAAGAALGLILFIGSSLQQTGLVYTTAGKAGFITGLYVIFVPLLGLAWGQRTAAGAWAGALMAVAGLYLLSFSGTWVLSTGDSLVLLSAVAWAVHVQLVGGLVRRFDVILLACLQFAVCSLLSLLVSLAREVTTVADLQGAVIPILYTGLLSTGVAFTLQVLAQRHARPAHTAIILSTEAVFAVLGGWMILAEQLSPRGLAGCALMLGGMLVAQLGPRSAMQDRAAD